MTAVEDKIPGISSLVKKTDYNTKISENEKKVTDHNNGKNITTPEFNTFTAEIFATRLTQANLVIKIKILVKPIREILYLCKVHTIF